MIQIFLTAIQSLRVPVLFPTVITGMENFAAVLKAGQSVLSLITASTFTLFLRAAELSIASRLEPLPETNTAIFTKISA
jgi:Na+/H+-dicarboxylate symporter